MEKIKEIITHYSIWATFLGLITILIKPFISIKQTLQDMLITFIVSMLGGLLAEYMDIPMPVKYGISGVCGLFGIRLYAIIDNILKSAQKDPFCFLEYIRGKKPLK